MATTTQEDRGRRPRQAGLPAVTSGLCLPCVAPGSATASSLSSSPVVGLVNDPPTSVGRVRGTWLLPVSRRLGVCLRGPPAHT
jgi:hypothetical protein